MANTGKDATDIKAPTYTYRVTVNTTVCCVIKHSHSKQVSVDTNTPTYYITMKACSFRQVGYTFPMFKQRHSPFDYTFPLSLSRSLTHNFLHNCGLPLQ